jgi:hypothetical protein
VVKKITVKGNSKKKAAPAKKMAAARKVARPATKAAAKYEQPGAPWWKRVPGPPAKS